MQESCPVGTTWEDRYDGHSFWGSVDTFESLLSDENLSSELDSDQRASVVRLKTALELLREHQQRGLKDFYTPTMLDAAQSQMVTYVISNLQSFVSDIDNNGDYINTAAANVDAIFDCIATWPPLPAAGQANAAGRAFSDYKKEAEQALDVLKQKNDELQAELVLLKSQITTVETQMTSVEERYTTSLEARDAEFSDAVGRVEQSGTEAYDKAIKAEVESQVERLKTLQERALELVTRTEEQRAEAEKLAIAAKDSAEWLAKRAFARDFGMQARRKSVAARIYDILGVGIIAAPLYFVLRHFLDNQDADGTVAVSLTRLSIILGAVILGGYMFSRGATNHRQARASKSAEIRLNTFEAFITALSEDEQAEIRNGMAKTIYLHGRLADEEPDSPNPFGKLLNAIAERGVAGKEE